MTLVNFGVNNVTSIGFTSEYEFNGDLPSHQESRLNTFHPGVRLDFSSNPFPEFVVISASFVAYASANPQPMSISTISGGDMSAIEFNIGTGFDAPSNGGFFETYRDGVFVDSGGFNIADFTAIISFTDPTGFDELRIVMLDTSATPTDLGNNNAIAVDHVVAQRLSVAEPGPHVLLALGLFGLGWVRYRLVARSRAEPL